MKPNPRGVYLLILGTFFVSGVAGLLYQVVWTRYLALFLGHTSYAVVAVLAAFMGGLALGNAWLGAKVDALKRPLLFYAGLEAGIGLYAAVFPRYYEWVHDLFLGIVRSLHPEGAARLALQFGFAGVTILLPTVLMGATLPALTKYVTRSLGELRGKVAALYAINSTGAVAGVLLAEWWWIPSLGLELVVYLGATLSLSIALITYVVSARGEEGGAPAASKPVVGPEDDETFTPLELRVALAAAGISGFVAMLYEIAWTRLLALALGSSTHAYSLMLATFISGIAIGSWAISRWKRRVNTLTAFAWAELALAGTLFVSMWFYDLLPYWFARMADLLVRRQEAYPVYELIQVSLCFGVMFVPAFCLGMTLPLVSRVATAQLSRTGRSVGQVFAVNTLGTVLGAALTGLWLLPMLGLAATFALGVGLNALIGIAVLGARRGSLLKPLALGIVATLGLTVVASAVLGERWSRSFLMGLWRDTRPPASVAEFRGRAGMFSLPYFRDGAGSTVAVLAVEDRVTGRRDLSLKVNGKSDASSGDDMSTQILAGHVPILLHPNSSEILVVGAGSGVTVGSLLQHPGVKVVDLVEISPEVVVAARDHFAPFNHDALRDPRCHTAIEDAKTFLKTTQRQYDVIITEPSNPWMAGVAAVFSREYYEDCKARLKPDGIVAQWVQTYETDDATFEMVVATFGSVFPYLSLWQTSIGDLLLVGAPGPFQVDLEAMAKRMVEPAVAADLKQIGVTRPVNVLTLQMAGLGDAFFIVHGDTRIHSDFNPVLEYSAQRAFFVRGVAGVPYRINEAQRPRPRSLLGDHLEKHPLTSDDCRALAQQFSKMGIPQLPVFRTVLRRWQALDPADPAPLRLLNSYALQNPSPDGDAARLLEDAAYRNDDRLTDLTVLRQYGDLLLLRHRTQRSAFHLPRSERLEQILGALVDLDPENQRVHRMRLAEVNSDRGQDVRARRLFDEALSPEENRFGPVQFRKDPGVVRHMMARLIDSELRAGRVEAAVGLVSQFSRQGYLNPDQRGGDEYLEMLARRAVASAQALRPPAAP
jgi:predicted membrane-bound spermidine synthase